MCYCDSIVLQRNLHFILFLKISFDRMGLGPHQAHEFFPSSFPLDQILNGLGRPAVSVVHKKCFKNFSQGFLNGLNFALIQEKILFIFLNLLSVICISVFL